MDTLGSSPILASPSLSFSWSSLASWSPMWFWISEICLKFNFLRYQILTMLFGAGLASKKSSFSE